jgi:hypothetical protein
MPITTALSGGKCDKGLGAVCTAGLERDPDYIGFALRIFCLSHFPSRQAISPDLKMLGRDRDKAARNGF